MKGTFGLYRGDKDGKVFSKSISCADEAGWKRVFSVYSGL